MLSEVYFSWACLLVAFLVLTSVAFWWFIYINFYIFSRVTFVRANLYQVIALTHNVEDVIAVKLVQLMKESRVEDGAGKWCIVIMTCDLG